MLRIFNTLSRSLEEFKPIIDGKVTFYHCGPTVYWTQHIGNLRGMTMADLIRRSLTYKGYEVIFARNYTDVGHLTSDEDEGEDKMEKGAKREGLSPDEIAEKYIKIFENDTRQLNIIDPDFRPRATEYVKQMIEITNKLLKDGYAYLTPRAVYFDVSKFPDYNKLNRQKIDKNRQGAGFGSVEDSDKKNPQDFALWFFRTGVHKNALQYWKSPFPSPEVEDGYGFPGWHIECSAMATELLGKTIDLHMGGIEHIAVHHTNEIAQSECFTGKKFVNYWLHNEHLLIDNEKMSKSVGNVYNLADIVSKGYSPMDLRYLFLQSHYRSKQNFTFEALNAAKTSRLKIVNTLFKIKETNKIDISQITSSSTVSQNKYRLEFEKKLGEDFNIPAALSQVWEVLGDQMLTEKEKFELILDFDNVLGLNLAASLRQQNTEQIDTTIPNEVKDLLEARAKARDRKEWVESDRIRDLLLAEFKIKVEDTATGQKIEILQ